MAVASVEMPFIIMEDQPVSAQHLIRELERRGAAARSSEGHDQTIAVAKTLPAGLFAIDIDMGDERRTEGLNTIGELNAMRQDTDREFVIVALTSHADFREDASAAGVDAFLVKTEPPVDALELIALQADRRADEIHNELLRMLTRTLIRQLEFAASAASPANSLNVARSTVRRALAGSSVGQLSQTVLSALDEQLRVADSVPESQREEILRECLAGAKLLSGKIDREKWLTWLSNLSAATPVFGWASDDDEIGD